MQEKTDLRVIKTKKVLFHSLLKLMKNKNQVLYGPWFCCIMEKVEIVKPYCKKMDSTI